MEVNSIIKQMQDHQYNTCKNKGVPRWSKPLPKKMDEPGVKEEVIGRMVDTRDFIYNALRLDLDEEIEETTEEEGTL